MLFETPTRLPLSRGHDHRIPLKKTEIEKMVREMKNTGIIRDSTNPFASLVILVKKKMEHGACVWIIGS